MWKDENDNLEDKKATYGVYGLFDLLSLEGDDISRASG